VGGGKKGKIHKTGIGTAIRVVFGKSVGAGVLGRQPRGGGKKGKERKWGIPGGGS